MLNVAQTLQPHEFAIYNRIRTPINAKLRKNHHGRLQLYSTKYILSRIMDEAFSQKNPLFITFVDLKKTFDSIDREFMFAILRHCVPDKIV